MTTSIVSFSHQRDVPEDKTGNGGGFVFDCRSTPNPYWDESLRGCTGRDKPIADFFDRVPARSVCFAERMPSGWQELMAWRSRCRMWQNHTGNDKMLPRLTSYA